MAIIIWIVTKLNEVGSFFVAIYLEILGWIYPFNLLAPFFSEVALKFFYMASDFYDFGEWLEASFNAIRNAAFTAYNFIRDIPSELGTLSSWWSLKKEEIIAFVSGYVNDIIRPFFDFVESIIEPVIISWNNFKDKIPSINDILFWFSDWWGSVLTQITAWGALTTLQIDSLIDSWFKSYAPFWEGWQEWKDKVTEFFTDPLQWLYDKLDEWFERFW